MWRNIRLDHLSVALSFRKVYCGKTAEWIRMPFGTVSGVSREMGVVDGAVMVEGQFRGEFGASHCNYINWDIVMRLFPNYFGLDLFYFLATCA